MVCTSQFSVRFGLELTVTLYGLLYVPDQDLQLHFTVYYSFLTWTYSYTLRFTVRS